MYLERKMPKVGTNEVFKGKKAMEKVILLLLKLGIHKLRSNQQGATKILRGFKAQGKAKRYQQRYERQF